MTRRRRPQRSAHSSDPARNQPPETNPALREAILEVVDTQLADNDPPEARETLERLVRAGYTREGARELIAYIISHEIFAVMSSGKPYNKERYLAALARLPIVDEDYG